MTPSNRRRPLHLLLAAPAFVLLLGAPQAQNSQAPATKAKTTTGAYEPKMGQPGKDVMWVPTAESLVDKMLSMAEITPQDYLVDLGSGDGRTVITAAQRGTRAHGIEFNPDMVKLSRQNAKKAGVSDKATFTQGDIFQSDFSKATVVTLFLLPELNERLRPTLLDMKPGTRVVSNSFDMGNWTPDETIDGGPKCQTYCRAYKWIVPAKVQGTWELNNKATLDLTQTYQNLDGHLAIGGKQYAISDAALQGKRIAFKANGRQYTGTVEGNQITGRDSRGTSWSATRQ